MAVGASSRRAADWRHLVADDPVSIGGVRGAIEASRVDSGSQAVGP